MMECEWGKLDDLLKSATEQSDKVEQANIFMATFVGIGSALLVGLAAWLGVPTPYLLAMATGILVACSILFLGDAAIYSKHGMVTSLITIAYINRIAKELDRASREKRSVVM